MWCCRLICEQQLAAAAGQSLRRPNFTVWMRKHPGARFTKNLMNFISLSQVFPQACHKSTTYKLISVAYDVLKMLCRPYTLELWQHLRWHKFFISLTFYHWVVHIAWTLVWLMVENFVIYSQFQWHKFVPLSFIKACWITSSWPSCIINGHENCGLCL